ncbi:MULTISPECIES: hypothetical protein [Pseudomonas]|uniref:Uncharacterized protein n=1 Tax=Pseudomonas fluorescens TaxID=294 RepID=A0A161ZG01_PSEFL|nr:MULTISPECIES: hypothetical protein [Pseudomonas]KZN20792.1 hypothetical protein A1D17_04415 [Pseudomonas fluorescens]
MRNPYLPTLLAAAILLGGCSHKPTELATMPSQSQYDDRILDSLGTQKYSEAQIIYNRQLNQFEARVKELEDKRKALEVSMSGNAYESGGTNPLASESSRIEQFQSETLASQKRIAQENSQTEKRRALIENGRDMALLEAERRSTEKLADIERTFTESQTSAKSASDRANAAAIRERDQKLVELENDQDRRIAEAKARAALRIADIESTTTRDISVAETTTQQAIASKKQIDAIATDSAASRASAVSSEASRVLDEQRISVVLASADAERRTAADIEAQQKLIDQMRVVDQGELAPMQQQIEERRQKVAELNRQISGFEGQIASVQSRQEVLMASQLSKLQQLNNEAARLAQVTTKLKAAPIVAAAPATPTGPSVDAIQFIANKESELSRVRADALARRGQQVAQINSQLEIDLANIRSNTRTQTNILKSQVSVATLAPAPVDTSAQVARSTIEADVKKSLAVEKTKIVTQARTELAGINTESEITKATVVAPVITGKGVYAGTYGDKPMPYVQAKPEPKFLEPAMQPVRAIAAHTAKPVVNPVPAQQPLQIVSTFKPSIGSGQAVAGEVGSVIISSSTASAGGVQPIVVAARSKTVYNVVYVYKDKTSFDTFQNYLRAYGVTDFKGFEVAAKGEYVIAAGRYYDAESAASRVLYLNKTTSTNHAKVITQELPM